MTWRLKAALVLGGALLVAAPARALDDGSGGLETLAPPASPAFTLLDVSPQLIYRPHTLQDLSVDLQSGVTSDGRAVSGFALEISANEILRPAISLQRYRESWTSFALQNLRLSVATARAAGDSAATDLAFGFSFPVFDRADPLRDKAYGDTLGVILLDAAPTQPGHDYVALEAHARERRQKLFDLWRSSHWNASRAEVALAASGRLVNSEFSHLGYAHFAAWVTAALRLGGWGQLLGLVRFDHLADITGQLAGSRIDYGGRVIGGSDAFNLYLEVIGRRSSFDEPIPVGGGDADNSGSWAFGSEYRIAPGLWVLTGLGSRFDDVIAGAEHAHVAFGLKWGLARTSRLGTH